MSGSFHRHVVERNERQLCTVDGCSRLRHGASRHCNVHHLREQRLGSPTARRVTKGQLAPYKRLAERFLKANSSHPAITQVAQELDRMLTEGAALMDARVAEGGPAWRPAVKDVRAKTAVELKRLRDKGASGLDLLRSALALHLVSQFLPHVVPRFTPVYNVALARSVLYTRPLSCHMSDPRRSRHGEPRRVLDYLSAPMLRQFGKSLALMLLVVLEHAGKAIERQIMQPEPTRNQKLARTIEAEPFIAAA